MNAMMQIVKQAHPDMEHILFGETILGWDTKKGKTAAYHQRIAETIPGETTRIRKGRF